MNKKFYKILSILICLVMLFLTSCSSIDTKHNSGYNYYVSGEGKGDGRSEKDPAASIEDVVATINEDIDNGILEAEKAYIYVVDEKNWNKVTKDGTHKMAYIGNIPLCSVDLVIQSLKKSKSHLAYKAGISGDENGGFEIEKGFENNITFKNLVIVSTGNDRNMYLGGAKVSFSDDVVFASTENWNGGSLKEDNELNIIHTERESKTAMYVNDMNIEISSPAKSGNLYIPGNGRHSDVSYDGNFYITLDNKKIGQDAPFGICFGSGGNEYFHATKIANNLNINIKNASQIEFSNGGNPNAVFSVEGAIQLLLNSEVKYNTTDIESLSVIPEGTEVYVLNNNTKHSDIISFTDEAGLYTVKKGIDIQAYNNVTGEIIASKKGEIKLTSGSYSLDILSKTENLTVYIKNEENEENKDETVSISNISKEKEHKNDVNIIIDKKDRKVPIVWGTDDSKTTFKKNLNLRVIDAAAVSNATAGGKSANTVVTGGIQLIIDSETVLEGDISKLKGLKAKKGVWQLIDKSGKSENIKFTEKAGIFEVETGYIAIATDVNGKEIFSEKGRLKLEAGKYDLVIEKYINNSGDKIIVNANSKVDLSKEGHTNKDGKLFIGWKNAKTGKPAKIIDNYEKGDILEAEYIDFTKSDFCMEEAQVRSEELTGLRFVFTQNKEVTKKIPEIVEYGSIILPTDIANGRELYIDTPVVNEWVWDSDTLMNFLPSMTGETPTTVVAENILEENEKVLKYTLCLTEISEAKQAEFYGVRGYIKYKDSNGIERIVYTRYEQSSLYKAATETKEEEKTDIHRDIIKYIEINDRAMYWNMYPITSYVSGTNDCEDKNPNHLMYKQAGLTVADVTLDTGFKGIEKTEICFFTDPHLNYINEQDILENRVNALSSYRGRSWFRDGSSGQTNSLIMKFAANFKKIVIGGDAVDYLSMGSLEMTRRLITDKSINGSIKMVLGNHEPAEYCQNDISCNDVMTSEQKYELLQQYWPNDVQYESEIMLSNAGKENIMLIYLNNGNKELEYHIESLTRDLDYARKNSIPVLLFVHIPLPTLNPDDANVYINSSHGGGGYGTAKTNTGTANLCGSHPDDAGYDLVRKYSDVVKGVFNGHKHYWAHTNIVGLDANGKENGKYIPQYTVYGSHYGGVMKITVE